MTLEEARDNIGKLVVYANKPLSLTSEVGQISSINTEYIFVRFGSERQSKACRPEDLEAYHWEIK